jgi:hypothetical protein
MSALDKFAYNGAGLESPATRWFAITPNDGADLAIKPRALYVGGAGNVAISNAEGDSAVLVAVPAGTQLSVRPDRVLNTGTTATGIVGLY